jgi:phenylalanyl-tRNA synthetase beta chain
MRVVYSWLKDFVDIDVPVNELADALTSAGLEVASIEQYHIPDGVKVARVIHTEKHPNADRLSVCKVDAGEQEPLTIVCGAPNVRSGMTAALATIGTVLGEDFQIKKSKIRGIESCGMLCSEQELGLSNDHDGIMDLPSDFKVGEPLSTYYKDDAVIEIEITPDRGDCLSILGVAREVSARFGLPLKNIAKKPVETEGLCIEDYISVSIEAADRCPRYCGRLIKGVQIKPSPLWMQRRLTLGGIRPINNVVDVTNYILLQYGQPMHAFDYSSLRQKKIIVKKAGKRLSFSTLDDIERELISEDLLICDGDRPVALAGIMGGAGSEILDSTTDVFLECAFFEQIGIRKTSKRLGLSTDSSYRFERGVDPDNGLIDAIDTAAQLILETAGGQIASGRIDEYPKPFSPRTINIRPSKTSKVLGVKFNSEQIFSILSSLGFKCTVQSPDQISCVVPLFRHDITIEEDLIEEIGRMYGYDNIVPSETAPVYLNMGLPLTERISDKLREALAFF